MQNELLSIGKMAEINNLTVATLRLYDELGLLHPRRKDPQSGYRYYDMAQNARLDMIAYMKELGMSLAEIADILKKEETKSALRLAKNTLKKLWKSVGPRKGRLRVHFGTGDPGSCGEICAFLGMVYPFIGNYVMIEPEMEQAVFDCDIWFRGHLTVFALLRAGWVILFNKEIKYLKDVMKPSGKEDK